MDAEAEVTQVDLRLVSESSLTVYPAAQILAITWHSDGDLIIVNAEPIGLG